MNCAKRFFFSVIYAVVILCVLCFVTAYAETQIVKPLNTLKVNSGFVPNRHVYSGGKLISDNAHLATDYAGSIGDKVMAIADGTVVKVFWDNSSGNNLVIEHYINGVKAWTRCCHLNKVTVSVGDHVTAGQKVAEVGNTGTATTGSHLHFQIATGKQPSSWACKSSKFSQYADGKEVNGPLTVDGSTYWNPRRVISGADVIGEPITATTLEFRNVTYPKTYKISSGGWSIAGGYVATDKTLTSIESAILPAGGGNPISKMSSPMSLSGNVFYVNGLDGTGLADNGQKFSKITTTGDYIWRLTAKDSDGRTLVMDMPFTAVSSGATSTATSTKQYGGETPLTYAYEFKNVVYPKIFKINTSNGWILGGGTLTCDNELRTITTKIVNSSGTEVSKATTRNISGHTYTIKSLDTFESGDNGVKFSKISSAGSYKWILIAKDSAGRELTLEMPFSAVSSGNTSTDTKSLTYNSSVSVTQVILNYGAMDASSLDFWGDYIALEAYVYPDNATNKEVTWSSSNESVATVNSLGHVYLQGNGTAVVTAMASDGSGKFDTCTITVSIDPTDIQLNESSITINVNETSSLSATVLPSNTANKNVIWSSDNTSVATVTNGVVTGKSAGTATISAQTEVNGWFGQPKATCIVTVRAWDSIVNNNIADFVKRCYNIILGRNPDAEGLEAWAKALASGEAQASQIIDGFVNSQEFLNKGLSKSQQVEVLYRAMLGRDPDQAGLAAWTDVLNQGYPFGSVINGFCGSTEFKNLCADYGIEPGSVDVGDIQIVTPIGDMGKIKAFVTRCYSVILGRDPDPEGLNAWADALATGVRKASEIIDGFVNSPEFLSKNLTKEEQVDILYNAMLGRGADPAGKASWVKVLDEGNPFGVVINGFCGSIEFTNLCAEYGIQPGSVQVKAALVKRVSIDPEGADPSETATYVAYNSEYINEEKIRAFIMHCYETVLGREGDEEGIANYTALIMDGKKTPKRVAYEFVFSPEFQGKLPGNEELIKILYRLYLNREPGAEELAGWIEMLDGGAGLDEVLKGFAESAEFRAIVKAMKE